MQCPEAVEDGRTGIGCRAARKSVSTQTTNGKKKEENAPCSRHLLRRLVRARSVHPPLNPIELLCRPRVRLVPLTPHRKLHRVLPAPQSSDRTVMRDVGTTLATEVLLEDEVGKGVGCDGGRIAREESRWCRGGRRGEGKGLKGGRRAGSGAGSGEEGGEGVQLGLGEVLYAHLVVELEAGHNAGGSGMVDTVESEEGNLRGSGRSQYRFSSSIRSTAGSVRTLTSLRSGRVAPRRLTTTSRQEVSARAGDS